MSLSSSHSLTITSVTSGAPVNLPTTLTAAAVAAAPSNNNTNAANVAQNLPAGTSISTVTVKQERHDEAEIQELAAKMVEAQKVAQAKAAAQQQQQQLQMAGRQLSGNIQGAGNNVGGATGQTNILNYLTRKAANPQTGTTTTITANGQQLATSAGSGSNNGKTGPNGTNSPENGEKKTCDEESQKGHFGWATFGKIHIPYIARQTEKYCAVRMVEMKLLNKYLNYLHPDIYSSCTCVRSYYITEAESRLLNEINHKHCDAQFGREMFTLKDLVVRLSDANKFYQFLDICYRKLLTGSKSPSDKCGFIRINRESVVPYTVRNSEQVVPLFYFEGETENLRQKADYLSGWDLAYLKFCCKVQGIRNELFSSESVAVISLTDIKSYFPNGTEFEDYWPSKVVDQTLLTASKNVNNSVHWTRQPTAPPPKILNPGASVQKNVQQQQQQQQVRKAQYPTQVQNANAVQQQQRMHPGASMIAPSSPVVNAAAVAAMNDFALTNGWSLTNAQGALPQQMLTHAQSEQVYRLAQQAHNQQQPQRGGYPNRNQMQNLMASRTQYNYSNAAMAMPSMNCTQTQQPPPLVRSASQNQSHMNKISEEDPLMRKRRLAKERVKRWKAKQTQDTLDRLRIKDAENKLLARRAAQAKIDRLRVELQYQDQANTRRAAHAQSRRIHAQSQYDARRTANS